MGQVSYMNNKVYCFDLDGTLCSLSSKDYSTAIPILEAIKEVNRLYDLGNIIKIFTARGTTSKIDYTILTEQQLKTWGLKYHELIMNTKPSFDILIDDRAINAYDWRKNITSVKGFISGNFDIIHPGYILLFMEAKQHCNHLIIGLHEDPSIERPNKHKPVQSLEERKLILSSIKYIDDIVVYKTEEDLNNILINYKIDLIILSDEYKNTNYTGYNLDIPVHFHKRDHEYSSSKLKKQIAESIKCK